MTSLRETKSYVIINKKTGGAVAEIYNGALLCKINNNKYTAIPILEYLQKLNKKGVKK